MSDHEVLQERSAGVLLHITSLPSEIGLGDFSHAKHFIDFLAASGMGVWQVLPLGPTHSDLSPYLCTSSLAGNAYLIDHDWLCNVGWLSDPLPATDFATTNDYRNHCLRLSYEGFQNSAEKSWRERYENFLSMHKTWLNNFALFTAIRTANNGRSWMSWDDGCRDSHQSAMATMQLQLKDEIAQIKFEQFVFYTQWLDIKNYANRKGVKIFGDMPLFVAHDSCEVWLNKYYFKIDEKGSAIAVAGVPPDYFSQHGQNWGNPVFNWDRLKQDGFQWWIQRMASQLELYDIVRIDHFRGLEACWEIPAGTDRATDGAWKKSPGFELLQTLYGVFKQLPIVAEDLGFITEEVHQLREKFNIPGMRVVQFAFDGSMNNPNLRDNHIPNCVVYTGTHDNNTAMGWYQSLATEVKEKIDAEISSYDLAGPLSTAPAMPWSLIDYTLGSPAKLVILPMQDILGLGEVHRLNTPGTPSGNWRWQFLWSQIDTQLSKKLYGLLTHHKRLKN